jgi:hypothetical protein
VDDEVKGPGVRSPRQLELHENTKRLALSLRFAAEARSVPRQTVQRLEKHVALAEQYPFMKRPGWNSVQVLGQGTSEGSS